MVLPRGVMAETRKPADKTINLKGDFLGASNYKNLIFEGPQSGPSMGAHGSEFTGTGNSHELRSQALAANTAPDKDTSIILSGSQQTKRDAVITKTKKREEREWTELKLAAQARLLSEQLARQIAELESAFEATHGDAWREQIANKVMDPDEIPQRRPDESMLDYRKRLEDALTTKMIDPVTGKLKAKYANSDDPDIRRYGDWAQARHTKRVADAYLENRSDPALSGSEREAMDREFAVKVDELALRAGQLADPGSEAISSAFDQRRLDAQSDESTELAGFNPGKPLS